MSPTISGGSSGGSGTLVHLFDSLLGASQATFDITGIGQTFLHLWLVLNVRCDVAGTGPLVGALTLNGDSGTNYQVENLQANNAVVSSGKNTGLAFMRVLTAAAGDTAGFASSVEFLFSNYAATTFNKAATSRQFAIGSLAGTAVAELNGHLWANTAAITRITVTAPSAGNWIAGSRATLYGLS